MHKEKIFWRTRRKSEKKNLKLNKFSEKYCVESKDTGKG